jgi:glycosyltransferase involved in cell wall biosynthesis
MDISVIISLLNEEESIPELIEWIEQVMQEHQFSYEIIMIDDGSTDSSWSLIEKFSSKNPNIKGIKFQRNYGKSAAIYCGFAAAVADIVITMDADLQDSPEEIPGLYNMIMKEGWDMVSGWKRKRFDPILTKNLPSKLYNASARWISGIKLHDFNCGLKAYRNKVVKSIEVYGEMHRYIPILVKKAGFHKIGEKEVLHQKRKFGISKFGMERFINGFLDLISITFMTKFSKKPMHFFGLWGFLSFIIGFGVLLYLTIEKILFNTYIDNRPLFYFGVLAIIFGTQLFFTGFIGELVARSSSDRNVYQIEKKVNLEYK